MNVTKMAAIGALGVAKPAGASAHVYTPAVGSDPDVAILAPDDMFVFKETPGLIGKIVGSWAELAAYPGFVIVSGDVRIFVTKNYLDDLDYIFVQPNGLNKTNGNKVYPGWKPVNTFVVTGATIYAWVTDATHGYVAYNPSVRSYNFLSTSGDPEGKGTGYCGWIGRKLPVFTIKDLLARAGEDMVKEAPGSEAREAIRKSVIDEIAATPEDEFFDLVYGASYWCVGPVGTPLTRRAGWLGHDSYFPLNDGSVAGSFYRTNAGSIGHPVVTYGGSMSPESVAEQLSRIMLGSAVANGKSLETNAALADAFGSDKTVPMKVVMEEQSEIMSQVMSLVDLNAKTRTSPRAVDVVQADGSVLRVGSTGGVDMWAGSLEKWEADFLFGKSSSVLQNRVRRVYGRAEDYIKRS